MRGVLGKIDYPFVHVTGNMYVGSWFSRHWKVGCWLEVCCMGGVVAMGVAGVLEDEGMIGCSSGKVGWHI